MWRCRLVLLNWVMTKMRSIPACRLLLIGMSISRNFPPTGTAGFARSRVRGQRRDPCPPPRMVVTIFSMSPLPPGAGILSQETVRIRYNEPMTTATPHRPLHLDHLGRVPYPEAAESQLAAQRPLEGR